MTYDELIDTVSLIINDDKFFKNGLTLVYELPENDYIKLELELKKRLNIFSEKEDTNTFDIEIAQILIKINRKIN